MLLGYLAIGIHQFLEYFAILNGSSIIYKVGLLSSISAMFFNLRASEFFFDKKLGSKQLLAILFLLAIHIFTREMSFENAHFYVRGKDHFYWGALWMIFFLYWNLIHFIYYLQNYGRLGAKEIRNFPFAALNISFILSAVYCYILGLSKKLDFLPACGSFEIVFDAPSIWCVFATIQGIFLYFYLKNYLASTSVIEYRKPAWKIAIILAIIIEVIIFLTLPIFSALSYKMILR
ncbi:hypothetical protein [Bacteriovorax sp. Seq25_V]|uniref:hypothetical protein n=1 Tax=Bacteriovorax sp. Seq25_V TaxID=1201288 RepID=UPI000389EBC6|nr:hypothetical protein [Bacteriovorax sp. Seq25_V]EQC46227.1 putative membrane protein [Bacteriovorax sp. Seq25_V]